MQREGQGRRRPLVGLVTVLITLALATTSLGAAQSKTFVSHRYYYSLVVPAGWRVIPASSTLTAPNFPEAQGPDTDRFLSTTKTDKGVIGVASERLKPGDTLQAWTRARIAAIGNQFACSNPERHPSTLAGSAAVNLVYAECFGFFDDYEVVHGGRGYDIYWLGSKVSGGDGTFLRALTGFRFHD